MTDAQGIFLSLKARPVWFSADDDLFGHTELAAACPDKDRRNGLKFLIQPVSRKMIHQVMTRHARTEKVEGRAETRESLDREAFIEDMIDLVLLDWDGLLGEDEEPLPCVRENKLTLANAYPRLGASLLEASALAMALAGRRMEESEKN